MTHRPFSLSRRGRRFLALALAACMLCAALPQALAANPEVDARDGLLFPVGRISNGGF